MPRKSATTEEAPRRGRPRPNDVIERDESVYAVISDTPKTTVEITAELGLESEQKNLVYASIWRLHRDGRVVRAQDSDGAAQRAWVRA